MNPAIRIARSTGKELERLLKLHRFEESMLLTARDVAKFFVNQEAVVRITESIYEIRGS